MVTKLKIFILTASLLFCLSTTSLSQSNENDPVKDAIDFMHKTTPFWSTLGYTTEVAEYTLGYGFAKYGGEYLLLESPELVVDLVKGGYYSAIASITEDVLLSMIEHAIKTPKIICRSIASTTIKEGLKDYEKAYNIVKIYTNIGSLTRKEAINFLKYKNGVLKLELARKLFIKSKEDYSFENQVTEMALKEAFEIFENKYKTSVGIDTKIPLIKSAMFIKEIYKILEAKKIGLAAFPPYIEFIRDIKILLEQNLEIEKKYRTVYDNFQSQNVSSVLGNYTGTSEYYSSHLNKTFPNLGCIVKVSQAPNNQIKMFVKSDKIRAGLVATLKSTIIATGEYNGGQYIVLNTRIKNHRYIIKASLRGKNILGTAYRYLISVNGNEILSYSIKFNCEKVN